MAAAIVKDPLNVAVWATLNVTAKRWGVTEQGHLNSLTHIVLERLGALEARKMGRKEVNKSVCWGLHHL
jgi:hypothetical protein